MAARNEAGETLVEVMMTVAIVSIAMVSIVAGIGASIRFSGSHRASANAGLALVVAADAVRTASGGTATCATLSTGTYAGALAAVTGLPPGWTSANLSITGASCPTVNGLSTLPRVTVVATAPGGAASESVDVVRRSVG